MESLVPQLPMIVIQLLALAFAVSVHESAHGWMADRLGDPTARWLGRITLNPIKHVDPVGTVAVPLILALLRAPVFGWAKPVPFVARNLRRPRRDPALVALAGPASNFALAVISAFILLGLKKLVPDFGATWAALMTGGPQAARGITAPLIYLTYAMTIVNIVLGVFNLVPVPPLDGSHLLMSVLPARLAWRYQQLQIFGVLLVLAVFYMTRLFDYLLFPFLWLLNRLLNL